MEKDFSSVGKRLHPCWIAELQVWIWFQILHQCNDFRYAVVNYRCWKFFHSSCRRRLTLRRQQLRPAAPFQAVPVHQEDGVWRMLTASSVLSHRHWQTPLVRSCYDCHACSPSTPLSWTCGHKLPRFPPWLFKHIGMGFLQPVPPLFDATLNLISIFTLVQIVLYHTFEM